MMMLVLCRSPPTASPTSIIATLPEDIILRSEWEVGGTDLGHERPPDLMMIAEGRVWCSESVGTSDLLVVSRRFDMYVQKKTKFGKIDPFKALQEHWRYFRYFFSRLQEAHPPED